MYAHVCINQAASHLVGQQHVPKKQVAQHVAAFMIVEVFLLKVNGHALPATAMLIVGKYLC